jgi:hypothetical protein
MTILACCRKAQQPRLTCGKTFDIIEIQHPVLVSASAGLLFSREGVK